MKQYTSTNISGALKIKETLDTGFVERFENIALLFLKNYTGEWGDLYSGPYASDEISVLDGKVSLDAKVKFKEDSVVGHLCLSEAGFKTREDELDESYFIDIYPNYSVECLFGGNTINVLPSRMAKHYRKIFSALENAVREKTVEPTRYIPTNKDTLTKFDTKGLMKSPMITKVMKINATLKDKGYEIDERLERLELEDKEGEWSFTINPLNGLIRNLNAEMLGGIYLYNWAGFAALDRLEKELLKIESIVSDIIPKKNNEIVLQSK